MYSSLEEVDSRSPCNPDEIEDDEKCVFCIRKNGEGGAIWTDKVRECRLEPGTVLLYVEGCIKAEGNSGGIYLILY